MNIPQYPIAGNQYQSVEEIEHEKHYSDCCDELRTAISSLTNTVTNQQVIIGDLVYGDADNENKISALTESLKNDYYTKEEVTELDNAVASQIVDVRSELIDKIDEKQDKGNYVTEDVFTQSLSEKLDSTAYTPYNDTQVKSDIASLQNNKADKTEIPSLDGYATESFVTQKIDEAQIGGEAVLENYYTKTDIDNTLSNYVTDSELTDSMSSKLDATAYTPYNDTQIKSDIADLKLNKADKSELIGIESEISLLQTAVTASNTAIEELSTALDLKADKSEIPTPYDDTQIKSDIISLQNNKADKTEIPTLEGYAKTSDITEAIGNQKFKTINNESIVGEGNIEIQGGSTIDAYTKTESDSRYLNLSGGTLTNKLVVGDANNTSVTNAYTHLRKVNNDFVGMAFAVGGDGAASIQHKSYGTNFTSARNDAVLSFDYKNGLRFGIAASGNVGEANMKKVMTEDETNTAIVTKINAVFEYDATTNTLNISTL